MSDSGEKTLPPSQKKLRDARKNGQLAHSRDMPAAVALIACLAAVGATSPGALKRIADAIIRSMAASERDFQQRAAESLVELMSFVIQFLGAAVAAATAAVVLGHIIVMRGFIFTFHPMSQGLQRLNPVNNIKQIFGIHAFSELLKAILKVVVLGGVLGLIIMNGLPSAVFTPNCGISCQVALAGHLGLNILVIGSFILLILGGADILLQNWIFTREMRMTHDEQKRERKEQDGSPEIKQEQSRLRRETIMGEPVGAKHATVFVSGEGNVIIGIRYVKGETPVPMIVFRSKDVTTAALQKAYPKAKFFEGGRMHATLVAEGKMGKMIPRSTFDASARMLYALSLI